MFICAMYDIPSPKRLQKAAKLCQRTGLQRIQKSVYLGKLTLTQLEEVREKALRWLDTEEDQFLLIPISRDDLSRSIDLGRSCGIEDLLSVHAALFF